MTPTRIALMHLSDSALVALAEEIRREQLGRVALAVSNHAVRTAKSAWHTARHETTAAATPQKATES